MQHHILKTHPEPFQAVFDGLKTFEFRYNDRDFKIGDILDLKEYNPITKDFSGRSIKVKITYILAEGYGIPEGYAILSIIPVE